MFWIEPGTAIEIAEAIFEQRSKLKQLMLRGFNYMKRGHVQVVTFGSGGTGKTTLGRLFEQEFASGSKPRSYERSVSIERYKMPGDLICTLHAAPGQDRYREQERPAEANSWANLYREIAKGKSVGIINVGSWGYHSIRSVRYQETGFYKPNMPPQQFLEHYLAERRSKEIEIVRELVPHISAAPGKVWMITLVTKQDLWWNQREAMGQFYREGAYQEAINDIFARRGKDNFQHEFVSASPVLDNFTTGNRELLTPTTAGYDENLRLVNLANLAKITNSLIQG